MKRKSKPFRWVKRHWAGIAMAFYAGSMLVASALMIHGTFSAEMVVEIDDRAALLQRRTAAIPVAIEVQDARWGTAELTDRDQMFEISRAMHRVPPVEGPFDDPVQPLGGKVSFIDGKSEIFSIGKALHLGDGVYFSRAGLYDLRCVERALTEQAYTVANLAHFFQPENSVVLRREAERVTISPAQISALSEIVAGGLPVEDAELDYALRSRGKARYGLTARQTGDGGGLLYIAVYGNGFNEVYDLRSGAGAVLYLSCDLLPWCRSLLD